MIAPWYHPRPIMTSAMPADVREALEAEVKRCVRCNAHHPVYKFNKDSKNDDGLARYCRPCHIELRRQSLHRHKEARNA